MRSGTRDFIQAWLFCSGYPVMLRPRGVAFVNGQFVNSKPQDLIYGMFLKRDLYDELWWYNITPEFVHRDLLTSFMMGGSGGAYADFMGYRAIAVAPLY